MANSTVLCARTGTLASGVDNVTFTKLWDSLLVYNADATNSLWVRVDGGTASVAGDECYIVPASNSLVVPVRAHNGGSTFVASVAGTGTYTVMGIE